ncbi:energy transducer TonB [Xanthobacter autotrophicus]|uniref:energy transducer TonB n=1 Tax=Xanthobacter TaxID=279 RepID=UPI0024ABC606|nr:energy transducer TonB [Xanthobacter autotrophicus]MDI4662811.1 energy transducer TonB [Xanthobacter autotrophicus]
MSAVHHHHWHDFDRTHLRDTVLRLAAGALFIVVVHAAAVYVALFWRKVEAGEAAPPAAIMIELAPLAASEDQVEDAAPGPQMVQAPESVPDAPDVPAEAAPPPEPVVNQVAEKLPEIEPSKEQAEVVLPKPEPKKEEVRQPPKQKVERPKKDAKPTRRPSAPVTTAAPRSDAPVAQSTAAPSPGSAAVRSAAIADWRSRAFSHLNRYKRPQGGNVGRPGVSISLSPSGSVTGVRLVSASGNEVLDREAVAMAHRASPFPAPPEGKPLTFSVSINFTSR